MLLDPTANRDIQSIHLLLDPALYQILPRPQRTLAGSAACAFHTTHLLALLEVPNATVENSVSFDSWHF
jgi:hypothetical protein